MIIALQTLLFFRESLVALIDHFFRPYYKKLRLQIKGNESSDDEDSDDHVFSEYDEEKGVIFYPPVYAQRYAAVSDCLMDDRWSGKLEKVVDFGYHEMNFIKYLIDLPGIKHIMGIDIETIPFRCSSDLLDYNTYTPKKENPLQITLFQGNAADPDFRLIGCDAIVAIEMIEHMLPHDLDRLVHTVFGFIKPQVAIFTTPNGDFNVLFKSLENNGLRRLDHFFEWSREQFHDWCSNILLRYPQYTVTTKGIGPGPSGTSHLGCCSQLAMFVAKKYHKQQDLDVNSFALVPRVPAKSAMSDMVCSLNSTDNFDSNMLCVEDNINSFSELLDKHSCMTIVLTSPSYSAQSLVFEDKMSQCNLDVEIGKNFLMFDDYMYYDVLIPSRQRNVRVYEIEDVASRLNCTTLHVKKFSKVTQNLLAKNSADTFIHTREVVDEIKFLTNMLNFNKDTKDGFGDHTWCNINWGENAPYWNQYYKVVREYNYPYEIKSDECRILDVVSEEINRLIDSESDETFLVDTHKLEIPVGYLMDAVSHITSDVDKVKDLLEWNGYEVVDGLLVHSRIDMDKLSLDTEEWPDDTVSDKDTETRLATISDGSAMALDFCGRSLYRALDRKVVRLRSMFVSDEDITSELDRIVCRLMKLALNWSSRPRNPPLSIWMQYKLFDLLCLTEKAIERRRRHVLDRFSLKFSEYCKDDIDTDLILTLKQIKGDDAGENIVLKYHHFVPSLDNLGEINKKDFDVEIHHQFEDSDFEDVTSNEFKAIENIDHLSADNVMMDADNQVVPVHPFQNEESVKIEAYSDSSNMDLVPYQSPTDISDAMSSGEASSTTTINTKYKRINNAFKYVTDINGKNAYLKLTATSQNKVLTEKLVTSNRRLLHRNMSSKTKIKKVTKMSSFCNYLKQQKVEYKQNKTKERKKFKEHQMLQSTASKPIPGSLNEICYLTNNEKDKNWEETNSNILQVVDSNIANTEICVFLKIITEGCEETIALQRNIGTDPDTDLLYYENEILLDSVMNVTRDDSFYFTKIESDVENVDSNTIFLNDINEPSTSKGVRHLSADVQCGPDVSITDVMLSASTSLTKMSKLYTTGIKIGDSCTDIPVVDKITYDLGTCTENTESVITTKKSIGIKIKDSDTNISTYESSTMTEETHNIITVSSSPQNTHIIEPKLLKSTSVPVTDDLNSGIFESIGRLPKSATRLSASSKNTSDFNIQLQDEDNNVSKTKYIRPKLSCGGIHVHSFKDRMVSEDFVYQGEWQRSKAKTLAKKHPTEPIIKKAKKRSIISKEHPPIKDGIRNENKAANRPICVRSLKVEPKKYVTNKFDTKNLHYTNVSSPIKTNKNVTKVASKIAMSSTVSKNTKSIFSTKGPLMSSTPNRRVNKNIEKQKIIRNNYIPLYLRKLRNSSLSNEKPEATHSKDTDLKHRKNTEPQNLDVKEITKDFVTISKAPKTNMSYMVFRNEIDTNKSIGTHSPPTDLIKNGSVKRSFSPSSQNSSTCSSPNSVATVRAALTRTKCMSNRKNATSSDRSNSGNVEMEAKSLKNKKYTRRVKTNKKTANIISLSDDKENLPESSRNSVSTKDSEKNAKKVNRTKSIYMPQMTTDNSNFGIAPVNSKSKSHLNKTIKYMSIRSPDVQKSSTPKPSVSKNKSYNETSGNFSAPSYFYADGSNETNKTADMRISDVSSVHSHTHQTKSSIISAIRKLVEDNLNDVKTHDDNDGPLSDSETVIISRDNFEFVNFDDSSSQMSVNTIPRNEDIYTLKSNIDNITLNENTDTKNKIDVELDLLSFKSVTSMSNSKFSEYYLADNEHDSVAVSSLEPVNINSVQDIFERKNPNIVLGATGVLATQAFSGFSMNLDTIAGDQPDHVNLIDSETGSLALDSARQTASEEIYVSGRSSDTYESCLYDDEADVPHWLFNIISQQQSLEESEAEDTLPVMIPLTDPDYDINGNVEPGVGVGAGAGDGRGIHSDHSQDSSGRGTSLSSTPTSSGPQSEAVLIDSSALTAQSIYGPISIPTTNTQNEPISVSVQLTESNRNEGPNRTNTNARSLVTPALITSDVDADVSSLDTDAMDSDN